MSKSIFRELYFNVDKSIFYELLENRDTGFGFSTTLPKDSLNELQIEVFEFLAKCYKKGLLGYVELIFSTDAVGEIKDISRTVDKVEKTKTTYIISNSY